jgi:hypothetical protein
MITLVIAVAFFAGLVGVIKAHDSVHQIPA